MSMLLVFRTNTAYDRFWEGRKTWGTIEETVSNILRMIRVCVKTDTAKEEQEKLQALKNTVAFAYSVRSYLNEETEVIYPKLYSLLNSQTKNFVQSKSSFHNFHAVDTAVTLVSASSSTQSDRSPILPKVSDRSFRIEDINLPLRLLNQLTEFITNIPDGKIKPTTANLLQMHTNTLSCAFKACLRIQTTPIPQAYSSHLYQTIWLYLLYLPWTLGSSTDLNVVVIQLIVAFMLLGTMVIGEEIEDPFGKDQNDLQTQKFCDNLYDELTFSFEAMNAN
ncbi:UPF0187 protein [Zancudomyces culisetae]|uniref:UPF0187 protein n=1 Tax=Zancudomyces culisetae TaxID=1213189 RepID=A0A1R1PRU9_ZANCU|nr:UPF0187 protein [Zancudomyces culisetae]|eukprot:OMH83710.1 UPF0187 protein [Zancudomyces culisetae]